MRSLRANWPCRAGSTICTSFWRFVSRGRACQCQFKTQLSQHESFHFISCVVTEEGSEQTTEY